MRWPTSTSRLARAERALPLLVATLLLVLGLLACNKDGNAPSAGQPAAADQAGADPAGAAAPQPAAADEEAGGEGAPGEPAGTPVGGAAGAAAQQDPPQPSEEIPPMTVLDMKAADFETMKAKAARFAPVNVHFDASKLDARHNQMLEHLLNAATVLDGLFWEQASADGRAVFEALRDPKTEYGTVLKRYVRINYGRFDRLDGFEPFIGETEKPEGATFYPPDMTKEELEAFLAAHPEQKEALTDEFTVVRRGKDGRLEAIPYSVHYAEGLKVAADELRKAAALADNESLKKYLLSRADAFLSNDYYQSDIDWMDVKGSLLDVTIGPYEVYEDRLFNYKAAFEAFITLNDPDAAAQLEAVAQQLPQMEEHLPIPDEHKNKARGTESPIRVVDVIYTAGDTRAGVQTLAFNLPNDERVREAKGSKKVLLRNVSNAKFRTILEPIARLVVAEDQLPFLKEAAYFNHTLMHEMSHGLGPGTITLPDGTKTTVNAQLKELYSTIEEAKADTLGIWNTFFLIDQGVFPKEAERETTVTTMAVTFRSVRFGAEEAHGKANMIVFNFLRNEGAYRYDPATQRFSVDPDPQKIREAVKKLAHELLMVQARGDYEGAKKLIETWGTMPAEMKAALARLDQVPVDIEPIYMVEPH